nr:immunoglobulin heavy chain junction region [Macaca mulatta]MOV38061.1 immunoglobulin heavy chain junction region [Macaca mulatta]MOV39819.1 immunoglobulin heavy chain junction region [Macaca mulatta]MOV41938.1 immunoglobulin heavy chain junction region [Macaca mulatta]MOV42216.1 immunoglobulin heavy chain junction region [Macaca mulatta]
CARDVVLVSATRLGGVDYW